MGRLIYLIDIPNRQIARSNLRFAFPDLSPKKVEVIIKRVYQHFGISVLEVLQTSFMSREQVIKHARLTGGNYLYQALKKEKGVILISAHIGNWEIGLHFLTCHFARPITLATRKLRPRLLNALYNYPRTRFGNRIIGSEGTWIKMVKTLHQGDILALMADLPRKKYSVEVNFFGHRAKSAYVLALLAIRCNSPLIPAFSFRDAAGSIFVEVGAPIEIISTGNLKADLQMNTQRITDKLEEAVRRHPDQWLWMQRRWKDYHAYLYPSYYARRKRKRLLTARI